MGSIASQYADVLLWVCAALTLVMAWLWQEVIKLRIWKGRVARYRAAAGALVYQKPFTNDTEAIAAIESVKDFDINALKELLEVDRGAFRGSISDHAASGKAVNGYRDMHKMVLTMLSVSNEHSDKSNLRLSLAQKDLEHSLRETIFLHKQASSSIEIEAMMTDIIGQYVESDKSIK